MNYARSIEAIQAHIAIEACDEYEFHESWHDVDMGISFMAVLFHMIKEELKCAE